MMHMDKLDGWMGWMDGTLPMMDVFQKRRIFGSGRISGILPAVSCCDLPTQYGLIHTPLRLYWLFMIALHYLTMNMNNRFIFDVISVMLASNLIEIILIHKCKNDVSFLGTCITFYNIHQCVNGCFLSPNHTMCMPSATA